MGNFVSKRIEDALLLVTSEILVALYIIIIVGNAAYILHGAMPVIWAQNRVDFIERIRCVEHIRIVADRSFADAE